MEPQNLALAISAANFMLTWGVALYMYLSNKNKATNTRITELEKDIDKALDSHTDRIAHLEGITQKAPTHEDLGKLYEKQNETARAVSQMAGEMKGMNDTLRLILAQIAQKGMA